jgi:Protein of unknown function (DUF3768)
MDTKTARIRALNDQLRQHLTGGMAVITPGIAALGPEAVERIVKTITVFDDFCHANDPHEEHDFGAFDADGQGSFSRSITSIRACRCIRPTQPILPSPSGSSRSCSRRSISLYARPTRETNRRRRINEPTDRSWWLAV